MYTFKNLLINKHYLLDLYVINFFVDYFANLNIEIKYIYGEKIKFLLLSSGNDNGFNL